MVNKYLAYNIKFLIEFLPGNSTNQDRAFICTLVNWIVDINKNGHRKWQHPIYHFKLNIEDFYKSVCKYMIYTNYINLTINFKISDILYINIYLEKSVDLKNVFFRIFFLEIY